MEYLSFDGEMLHVHVTLVHDVSYHNNVMSINSTHHHANKYQLVSFLFLFVLFISEEKSCSLLYGCTNGISLFSATCVVVYLNSYNWKQKMLCCAGWYCKVVMREYYLYLFCRINLESEIYCVPDVFFAFEKYLVMSGVIDMPTWS